MNTIELTQIIIGDRVRKDLGDIDSLKESIQLYGLIQPIVINHNKELVAGGRRLEACKQLGMTEVPFVYKETLSEDNLREMELEENVRRKDMTWQERCVAIAEIHKLKVRRNISGWGVRETGELCGISGAHVSYNTMLAKELKDPKSVVHGATGFTEALRMLAREREKEAEAKLAAIENRARDARPAILISEEQQSSGQIGSPPPKPSPYLIPLSEKIFNLDSLTFMSSMKAESIDCIITDPPYGIDMANLDQTNTGIDGIERVEEEHMVSGNLDLLEKFFPLAFNVLKDKSWLALWYDMEHHNTLVGWAERAGFKVQRWPLVWCKTHPCINQVANVNYTKATEAVLLCRKGNATLVNTQKTNFILADNFEAKKRLGGHPFVKPREVWKFILDGIAIRSSTVLDPFAGVGSLQVACIDYCYKYIACEINTDHFNKLNYNLKEHYKSKLGQNVEFV